ncbi:MAG: aminopeptidase N [Colwellia sp.]|nr:MAG: aminopeptidase N [Colwellia sp.]
MRTLLKLSSSKKTFLATTTLITTLLLNACVTTKKDQSAHDDSSKLVDKIIAFIPRAENQYLTQEQAFKRSTRLSNVSYQLNYNLTGEEEFSASSTINFALNDNTYPLTIDLNKAQITSVIINGFSMPVEQLQKNYNQWFITLPKEQLIKGSNTVTVNFTRKHSTNGEGLHRFKDPVDDKVYLYSHFEPAAAQQMFALFDQPDLKATFEMTVSAPQKWTVFSATKENKITPQGDFNLWHFPKSKTLSPYNFSLHAGPYKIWQDNSGKYPLRLFSRQSVSNQITPEHWFTYTQQGFNFFDDYFGIDYPFKKYDQILVPDFLYGAMENAAAVTFAEESFLTNGEMSQNRRQRLASVIMHEMAHQWFGNLATMKWWNGLWLNESFAAFMATLATSEATEFTNAWRSFYADGKQRAYRADQRITTHPIEVPVPSTANAFDNIDAITYSKGAAVLNQLRHLLGEKTFQQGIHNYLSDKAYKNAVLDDFINSLAKASGKDLTQWQQKWLYQAGVNTIEASYQCNAGKISSFQLLQTANASQPTLREQKVQIALFKANNPGFNLTKKISIIYQGKSTQVNALVGDACPDLVYPNYQDWAFVKVNLDARSFTTTQHNLAQIQDPLLRSMLWQSLWDSVRDGKLPLNEYLHVALANAPLEQDYTTLEQILRQISSANIYLNKGLGSQHDYVKDIAQQLEEITWQSTLYNSDNKNMQHRWFNSYLNFAHTDSALDNLYKLLNGQYYLEGLIINQDIRWDIIAQLSRFQHAKSAELIIRELALDSSDTGEKSAIHAQVIAPNTKVKNDWLAKIQQNNSDIGFSKLRTAMSALYPSEQNSFSEQSATQFILSLTEIDKTNGPVFMRSYNHLIPATCSEISLARLTTAINELTTLSVGTKRSLLIKQQEDQRCLLIKNKMTL